MNRMHRRRFLQATAGVGIGSVAGVTGTAVAEGGDQIWSFEPGNTFFTSPTVVDGTVYVGSGTNSQGRVYALDAESGNQSWKFTADNTVQSAPTVVGGTAYVASTGGNIYALDPKSGEKNWQFSTGRRIGSSPAVLDGVVYAVKDAGTIHALDGETGETNWSVDVSFRTSLVTLGGTLFTDGGASYTYALDPENGETVYKSGGPFEGGSLSSPTLSDGTIYGYIGNTINALDAPTGEKQWESSLDGTEITAPTVLDGTLYVGTHPNARRGTVHALDSSSGETQWTFNTDDIVTSPPTVADGTILIGTDGRTYALNAETGEQVWNFSSGSYTSAPTVVDGTAYIGTFGEVYAVDADVSGSSEDSRVMFRTGGHHDTWRDVDLEIEPASNADTEGDSDDSGDDTDGEEEKNSEDISAPEEVVISFYQALDDGNSRKANTVLHTESPTGEITQKQAGRVANIDVSVEETKLVRQRSTTAIVRSDINQGQNRITVKLELRFENGAWKIWGNPIEENTGDVDDDTEGDSSGDETGDSTDSDAGDSADSEINNSTESDTNASTESDESGPGFGIGTALTGLGGAGYFLKQRFGTDTDD